MDCVVRDKGNGRGGGLEVRGCDASDKVDGLEKQVRVEEVRI